MSLRTCDESGYLPAHVAPISSKVLDSSRLVVATEVHLRGSFLVCRVQVVGVPVLGGVDGPPLRLGVKRVVESVVA